LTLTTKRFIPAYIDNDKEEKASTKKMSKLHYYRRAIENRACCEKREPSKNLLVLDLLYTTEIHKKPTTPVRSDSNGKKKEQFLSP
jgi:hypothetical protein